MEERERREVEPDAVTGREEPSPTTILEKGVRELRELRIPASEDMWAEAPLSMTHSVGGCRFMALSWLMRVVVSQDGAPSHGAGRAGAKP